MGSLEGYEHLCVTFEQTERAFPDLMEPYSIRLGDASSPQEKMEIMQAGLRETIKQRHLLRECRTIVAVDDRQEKLAL